MKNIKLYTNIILDLIGNQLCNDKYTYKEKELKKVVKELVVEIMKEGKLIQAENFNDCDCPHFEETL